MAITVFLANPAKLVCQKGGGEGKKLKKEEAIIRDGHVYIY